jgi:hypothetical protein
MLFLQKHTTNQSTKEHNKPILQLGQDKFSLKLTLKITL